MSSTILVVDDEANVRELCCDVLAATGYEVCLADCGDMAIRHLETGRIDVVLTDLRMPGLSGIELLRHVKENYPDTDVVVMTAFGTIPTAVEATRLGAYDYITKPFEIDQLTSLMTRLMERRELLDENRLLRNRLAADHGFGDMIGESSAMQDLYRLLGKFAGKRHPILITGESGTGKELIARAIHAASPWKESPFVPVDCGALSATLIDSELFGHVRGAFTGATQDREGLLATARHGTVFLDEIGELPIELQAKLLRALQEGDFRQIGSNTRVRLQARVIAATNRNLEEAVQKGSFREDLYFRLNVLTVKAPALRERKNDIPLLAQHFIRRHGGPEDGIVGATPEAMACLQNYDWPGNVRELENHIRRA